MAGRDEQGARQGKGRGRLGRVGAGQELGRGPALQRTMWWWGEGHTAWSSRVSS